MYTSVLIVAGGASPGSDTLKEWATRYEGIIAADSGLDTLLAAGLEADTVTGDYDSISTEARKGLPEDCQQADPNQQNTDLEKAIRLAIDLGVSKIGLACATGSRLDHSVNAISMILRYAAQADIALLDACGEAHLVLPPGTSIDAPAGTRISLIPTPEAIRITSSNLRYPLNGIDLRLGGRDAISNEVTASPAQITFEAGSLLLYRQNAHRG